MAFDRTEDELIQCLDLVQEDGYELIVFNDDEHTFDYVIRCLMAICRLSEKQATNCTNIIHYHGKCTVKHGDFETLSQMGNLLTEKGLKNIVK